MLDIPLCCSTEERTSSLESSPEPRSRIPWLLRMTVIKTVGAWGGLWEARFTISGHWAERILIHISQSNLSFQLDVESSESTGIVSWMMVPSTIS
jgi:hypothetical protein